MYSRLGGKIPQQRRWRCSWPRSWSDSKDPPILPYGLDSATSLVDKRRMFNKIELDGTGGRVLRTQLGVHRPPTYGLRCKHHINLALRMRGLQSVRIAIPCASFGRADLPAPGPKIPRRPPSLTSSGSRSTPVPTGLTIFAARSWKLEPMSGSDRRIGPLTENSSLPAPEFEEVGTRFRVTLRSTTPRQMALDDVDRKALGFLSDGEGHPTSEIARHVGRSTWGRRP